MESVVAFFVQWGYVGLFLGSFVAGSVLPLSSEAILMACVGPLHLNPWICLLSALAGNVAGGMTCYWLGHLGNLAWIERWTGVKKDKLDRTVSWVQRRGAWMAFFAFVPILGSAITVALGFLRSNAWQVCLAMTIGKFLRYLAVIWGSLKLYAAFTA